MPNATEPAAASPSEPGTTLCFRPRVTTASSGSQASVRQPLDGWLSPSQHGFEDRV